MSRSISRRERAEPGLRVAHRRRGVIVDRAEVALAVDQRIAQGEVLRHPDQRLVDRRVAVRVVLTHHLADDEGALAVRPVGLEAEVVHRVENPAVHGLQPVPDVRAAPGRRSRSSRSRDRTSASPSRARAARSCRVRASSGCRRHHRAAPRSDIEEPHVPGMALDELLAGLDLVPHQVREGLLECRGPPPRRSRPAGGCGSPGPSSSRGAARVHLAEPLEARRCTPSRASSRTSRRSSAKKLPPPPPSRPERRRTAARP